MAVSSVVNKAKVTGSISVNESASLAMTGEIFSCGHYLHPKSCSASLKSFYHNGIVVGVSTLLPCYSKWVHRPVAVASLMTLTLSEMQKPRHHPRPTKTGCAFSQNPQVIGLHINV